jgi:hypothetical protein
MGSFAEVLMTLPWLEKGCPVCRHQWEIGEPPPEVGVNVELHSTLHKCSVCGTYWEQTERYADVIAKSKAKKLYPEAFATG